MLAWGWKCSDMRTVAVAEDELKEVTDDLPFILGHTLAEADLHKPLEGKWKE